MARSRSTDPAHDLQRSRLLVLDASTWLLERGELEAARGLFVSSLDLEPPLELAAVPGSLFVRVVAPAQFAYVLLDDERPEGWQVRRALDAVLPAGLSVAELAVASESVGGSRLALVA